MEPGADLQGAGLGSADLREAALATADLRGASLGVADLTGADLSGAELRDASLTVADLAYANLFAATLGGDTGYGADMRGANLGHAVWSNAVADEVRLIEANLSFADLRGWYATEVYASGASFAHANLDGSYLAIVAPGADFTDASLREAVFEYLADTDTSLDGANFIGADLTGASFLSRGSGLYESKIEVLDADFSSAVLRDAVGLANTDGAALYDSETDFTHAWADLDATIPFDPVAAGWTLVPEPGTAFLLGLGLAGFASRPRAV